MLTNDINLKESKISDKKLSAYFGSGIVAPRTSVVTSTRRGLVPYESGLVYHSLVEKPPGGCRTLVGGCCEGAAFGVSLALEGGGAGEP